MTHGDTHGRAVLRRRLFGLVYRDAARAYGAGLGLVLLPMVYLLREWPPWVIRDALRELPAPERALTLASAHALYGLVTMPVVRQLLASERLRFWWTLPLSARWWRGVHLRHLGFLDAPWLIAIAYGALPLHASHGAAVALMSGLAFAMLTLAGQIALVSIADRGVLWLAASGSAWALAVALAVLWPAPLAALLGAAAVVPAVRRLGRPMPEISAVVRGRAGGPPVLALIRLGWLAARRRDSIVLAWGVAVQLGAVGLAALAITHVGLTEPSAAAALRRGLAVVAATVGTALVLRSARVLHGDRPTLDTWGITPAQERWARLGLAAAGVVPALVVGSVVLPGLGPVGRAWTLDLLVATGWAAVTTVRLGFALEARRRMHEPRLLRHLPRMGLALILTGLVGTPWVLLPWAAIAALRLPATQRAAERARRRFETAHRDDHHR